MEHRISYAVIGAFVIILGGVLAAALVWLAAGGSGARYRTYAIYLKAGAESLNRDSSVLYHGVHVGHVTSVALDPRHPERAQVLLGVRENVSLKTDTEAKIEVRGFTGSGYIELSGGAPSAPVLHAKPGQKYPVIPAQPGTLASLTGAVHKVAGRLVELSNRLDKVLSDQNIAAIGTSLKNIRRLTSKLAARSDEVASAIDNMNATMSNARAASSKLPGLVAQVQTTIGDYDKVADKLGGAASGVKRASRRLGALAPKADNLVSELSRLSANLNALVQRLRRQPNILLFGAPAHPGPGESKSHGD
jgi:phospholipid/cholesterol/gamma-HCH transport system substrate-binding protein